VAGEKKFGTSMFGFKRADVNAYIERIIREFDQRLKEKDDENSTLKAQVKDLKTKYEDAWQPR
jgi:cell division septum initiation protein DivIVA